ncbi:hypothetical protein GB931_00195 [Modestobacter sp. I12A-02628]|uniref:Catalytic LigB subunit of aromatic ring-opening dioxygenase n=1 Tax=Goekera deserti TaxID=2497753 RepID=A0A7K3WI25_9ACTN|nr:hypothetical protein [Goekera deserti]NDI50535.1 hypothetical protein [Goekera deserti]NEL56151.1 hypothetical protein [Goekera deserti]
MAFCPQPPLLLPAVAGTAAAETVALRAACRAAVTAVTAQDPAVLLVVGDGPAGVRYGAGDAGDLRGHGVDLTVPFSGPAHPDGRRLPPAHTIGAWLLDDAGHRGPRVGVAAADLPAVLAELTGRLGVLVMGDGSARRSEKAPGALDPAAAPFDAAVARALADGDAAALAALDPGQGERLLAAGVPAWRAVGAALAGRALAGELLHDEAPFGVGYLVATWRQR